MSRDEARAVKLYVDDMMKKGYVERSTSAWAVPLLVVRKPGGGIRICVDYRGLNAHTVKNRNALPLIRDMLAKLSKSRYFSKVDVIAAFNKIYAGLPMDILKLEFLKIEVKFLGLIITADGIKMDPEKRSFHALKIAFCSDVVLAHFDPDLKSIVETDASDYVYVAVLSQVQPDGLVRPVAYLLKKMLPTECNYEIYDKELLAIVRAFEEWRPELAGVPDVVEVLTDYRGLEFFRTKRNLNRRQARWAEFLEEFDFRI
ncbi:hypothetical protein P3342_004627 [Pyrenophora teres f. teres]|nr:hypothetical protein P3342_004627 [Pyrenophora teres f. teres]